MWYWCEQRLHHHQTTIPGTSHYPANSYFINSFPFLFILPSKKLQVIFLPCRRSFNALDPVIWNLSPLTIHNQYNCPLIIMILWSAALSFTLIAEDVKYIECEVKTQYFCHFRCVTTLQLLSLPVNCHTTTLEFNFLRLFADTRLWIPSTEDILYCLLEHSSLKFRRLEISLNTLLS